VYVVTVIVINGCSRTVLQWMHLFCLVFTSSCLKLYCLQVSFIHALVVFCVVWIVSYFSVKLRPHWRDSRQKWQLVPNAVVAKFSDYNRQCGQFSDYITLYSIRTRELYGDGDDCGNTTVMGLDFMTHTAVIAGMGTAVTVQYHGSGDGAYSRCVIHTWTYTDRQWTVFSHLFTLQFTHPFVIICFEVFQCEIHGMVPFYKLICYMSII